MKWWSIFPLFLGGCITFSMHGTFIDSMDTLVYNSQNSKITIDDNQSAKKYVVKEEYILNHLIIHYAHPGYGGTCYYHVIVDNKTRLLVGWGFDEDKGNPKVCGVAG